MKVKWEQEYVVEKMIRVVGISDEKVGNQPGTTSGLRRRPREALLSFESAFTGSESWPDLRGGS